MDNAAKLIQGFFALLALLMTGALLLVIYSLTFYAEPAAKAKPVAIEAKPKIAFSRGIADKPSVGYTFGGDPNSGKKLFRDNCAACHSINMKTDMTGPALMGVVGRWNSDTSRLFAFIRNSSDFIATGDEYAIKLHEKFGGAIMTPFPTLTDKELRDLLRFISL